MERLINNLSIYGFLLLWMQHHQKNQVCNNPLKSLGLLGSDMDGVTPSYWIDRYWGLSVRGILGVGE